jgi:hypothetical protein
VGKVGKTRGRAAERAKELLDRVKSPTVGVALVGVSHSESGYGRYYRYRVQDQDRGLFGWRRLLGRWRGAPTAPRSPEPQSPEPESSEAQPTAELTAAEEEVAEAEEAEEADVSAPTAST